MRTEIKVRSNEFFTAPPNLNRKPQRVPGELVQDEIRFAVQDLGIKGSIRYVLTQLDSETTYPFVYPAGRPALPLIIAGYLYGLSKPQLKIMHLALTYGEKTYEGDPSYDDVELSQEGYATLRFFGWKDPLTRRKKDPVFPQESTKNIKYMIKV